MFSTPDLSISPPHVPSLWRAVLIADFETARDKQISRVNEKMSEIIKGNLCWTVPREDALQPCVPKPLQEMGTEE